MHKVKGSGDKGVSLRLANPEHSKYDVEKEEEIVLTVSFQFVVRNDTLDTASNLYIASVMDRGEPQVYFPSHFRDYLQAPEHFPGGERHPRLTDGVASIPPIEMLREHYLPTADFRIPIRPVPFRSQPHVLSLPTFLVTGGKVQAYHVQARLSPDINGGPGPFRVDVQQSLTHVGTSSPTERMLFGWLDGGVYQRYGG